MRFCTTRMEILFQKMVLEKDSERSWNMGLWTYSWLLLEQGSKRKVRKTRQNNIDVYDRVAYELLTLKMEADEPFATYLRWRGYLGDGFTELCYLRFLSVGGMPSHS